MYSLALLTIAAFLLSLFLTPLVRNLARRWGLVDHPGDRKIHATPIPRIGGVSVALAYVTSYALLLAAGLAGSNIVWSAREASTNLLPGVIVIFAVGLIDDLRHLKPWQKLIGEVLAAVLAWSAGVHVTFIAGIHIHPALSFFVTIAWLLLCTNAVNLIDGVDGLATGVGLFAACTMLLSALLTGRIDLALATAPLVGALLGFLRYNFNPATIFLGDSGSLFIGFLLGCYGVLWSQKAATILGMTAPLMSLTIPLLDTSLAIARRFLRQKPIFGADRGHIHHRLLDRGLTPRKVALLLYAFCALGAICSLAMLNADLSGYVLLIFCAATWIGVQHLGYVEFGTVGRMFLEGAFRRVLNSQLALQTYEQSLIQAATVEECWRVVEDATREFGFHKAVMHLAGHSFEYVNGIEPGNSWHVRIPISAHDYIELTRSFGDSHQHSLVAPFADTLRRTLAPKLPVLARARALSAAATLP